MNRTLTLPALVFCVLFSLLSLVLFLGCGQRTYEDLKGVNLLVFHADWCSACQEQKPVLRRLEQAFPAARFQRINVETDWDLAREFGVETVPNLIVVVDGRIRHNWVGGLGFSQVAAELTKLVAGE